MKDYKTLVKQAAIVKINDWGVYLFSILLPFNLFIKVIFDILNEIDVCC